MKLKKLAVANGIVGLAGGIILLLGGLDRFERFGYKR